MPIDEQVQAVLDQADGKPLSAGPDVPRGEGEAYAQRLRAAGVIAKSVRHDGMVDKAKEPLTEAAEGSKAAFDSQTRARETHS